MKFLAYLVCYLIYPLSFIFPRNKKKWAFGSFRNAFNDNAKYLFIYWQIHRKDVNVAWLSMSKKTVEEIISVGLKAYFILSPQGIWHALTSKYWFFNAYTSDIMFAFSGGAICVNLWHGVGLKRIEFNIDSGKLADRYQKKKLKEVFYHPETFKRPDWLLSSTPFQTKMFALAFRIPEDHCLEFGYPRNEILQFNENKLLDFIDRYESRQVKDIVMTIRQGNYRKVFIYMPTWRDSQREIFVQSFDLVKMNALLQAQNSLMLLKPHANVIIDKLVFQHYSNIVLVDGSIDVYPILPFTNVLITDYSSILYDYILMDGKDVILYLYDYEDYVKERDFFYPYDENVVGKKVLDFDELCRCIVKDDCKIDETQREKIVEKFWGDTVRCSSSSLLLTKVFCG